MAVQTFVPPSFWIHFNADLLFDSQTPRVGFRGVSPTGWIVAGGVASVHSSLVLL